MNRSFWHSFGFRNIYTMWIMVNEPLNWVQGQQACALFISESIWECRKKDERAAIGPSSWKPAQTQFSVCDIVHPCAKTPTQDDVFDFKRKKTSPFTEYIACYLSVRTNIVMISRASRYVIRLQVMGIKELSGWREKAERRRRKNGKLIMVDSGKKKTKKQWIDFILFF